VKLCSPHLWGVIRDSLTVSPAFLLYQWESVTIQEHGTKHGAFYTES